MSGWVHKTSWLSCHPTATGKWGPAFFEIGCETPLSHSLTSKEYCLKIVHPELLLKDRAPLQRPRLDGIAILASTGHRASPPDHVGGLVGHHGLHARQAGGCAGIDAPNARMGMGAAQHARIQHTGELE